MSGSKENVTYVVTLLMQIKKNDIPAESWETRWLQSNIAKVKVLDTAPVKHGLIDWSAYDGLGLMEQTLFPYVEGPRYDKETGWAQPDIPMSTEDLTATLYEILSTVRPGEYTTYGALSMAIDGTLNSARAIGQIIAARGQFDWIAHRVLKIGGEIPQGSGNDPRWAGDLWRNEAARRLAIEGVPVREGRWADKKRCVIANELVKRFKNQATVPVGAP